MADDKVSFIISFSSLLSYASSVSMFSFLDEGKWSGGESEIREGMYIRPLPMPLVLEVLCLSSFVRFLRFVGSQLGDLVRHCEKRIGKYLTYSCLT